MKSINFSQFVIAAILGLTLAACEDPTSGAPDPSSNTGAPLMSWATSGPDRVFTGSQVKAHFASSNMTGLIWLSSTTRSDFTTVGGTQTPVSFDGVDEDASGVFVVPGTNLPLSIGEIAINQGRLYEFTTSTDSASGNYTHRQLAEPLNLQYGSGSNLVFNVDSTSSVPPFGAQVSLAPRILLSGLSRGQVVPRSQDLVLTWNAGSNSDLVYIQTARLDWLTDSTSVLGIDIVAADDGSFTIPAATMALHKAALTNISVRRIQKHTVTLSNGKTVQILGQSKQILSVTLL